MSLQKLFDPTWYLTQNPDVAQAVANGQTTAWQHFLQFGQSEARAPLALFDATFYLQQNPDVAAAVQAGLTTAAQHFAQHGINEVRKLAPAIDLGAYLKANPDVAQAVEAGTASALVHLISHGLQEARDLGNGIRLDVFSSDPVFLQALDSGSVAQALARVDAVAPFLPDFATPAGWTPRPDTPIPTDFVPPAGQPLKLVIPEGVKVPDGITLPDTFLPVSGGTTGGGGDGANVPPSPTLPGQAFFTTTASTIDKNSSDASTALVLDGNYMVVGDDEAAVLRVYNRDGGDAVAEWSIKTAAGALTGTKAQLGTGEIDIEGSTRIGDKLYFIGSHSNKKGGNDAPEREYLFSVTVNGTGADTVFALSDVTEKSALTSALIAWDNGSNHGKGAGYYGLKTSSEAGIVPEGVNGFSIEGLAASSDGKSLYLGFRAPQANTVSREKALIVSVKADTAFNTSPIIESAIELNLGGRGIRSIEQAADGSGYLILAGPAGSASAEVTQDFRLYRWDGSSVDGQATGLTALDVHNGSGQTVSLDSLLAATGGSFETLVEVKSTATGTAIQLLQDNGDTLWEGQTKVSKDLSAGQQKFVGNWVTIGGDVTVDPAPTLMASNIAIGATPIGSKADLVLKFDEAVKWGTGAITLKDGNGSVVETFSVGSSAVNVAYNTITINPTNDLAAAGNYVLEFGSAAIQDLNNQAWNGTTLAFSVAAPVTYSLLISEVNSNATGGDFFELYNHGSSTIDLSGWRWIDTTSTPSSDDYGVFGNGVTIGAGEVLLVGVDSARIETLTTSWQLAPEVKVVAIGGKGLGGGDAVVLYDAADNLAAAFNYTPSPFTAPDGSEVRPSLFNGTEPTRAQHAGAQAGGNAKDSAVWDGRSIDNPNYIVATGTHPGFVDQGLMGGKGTPGYVLLL